MRIRRSSSIIVDFSESRICVFNFLRRTSFVCNTRALDLLSSLDAWTDIAEVGQRFKKSERSALGAEIEALLQLGGLVAEDTSASIEDEKYRSDWEWETVCGAYHFGIMDADWATQSESAEFHAERKREKALPPAHTTDHGCDGIIQLPEWQVRDKIAAIMSARRSKREFTATEIELGQLADCLYSGLGIQAIEHDPVHGSILKMTPSGGARNPYEGFVYALNVNGVARAIYHYSGWDHTLAPVKGKDLLQPSELLGNQEWIDKASAVIFLVANFDRAMWRYSHPNGYKVVLIEAGHIAQNILLTAERLRLGAVPTGAVNDSALREALSLDRITQTVVYAIVVGRSAANTKSRQL